MPSKKPPKTSLPRTPGSDAASESNTLNERIHSLFADLQDAQSASSASPAPLPEGEDLRAAPHPAPAQPAPIRERSLDRPAPRGESNLAEGDFLPLYGQQPLTQVGYTSLSEGRTISAPSQMAVPFDVQTTASPTAGRGLLEIVDSTTDRLWSEDERRLVEQVADQLSLALENARLFQETESALLVAEERRQVADTLSEIARAVGSSLELQEVVERLLNQLPNLIEFTSASIQLMTATGGRILIGGRGFDVEKAKVEETYAHRPIAEDPLVYAAYQTRQPLLVADTYSDPRWQVYPNTAHIRCWMVIPLVAGAEVLGFLTLDSSRIGAYTNETAALASAFGAQAAVAIRNARLFQQVQDTLAETDALYQASAEMNAVQDYADVLRILRKSTAVGHPAASRVTINLFDRPWTEDDAPEWITILARWQRSQDDPTGEDAVPATGMEVQARLPFAPWSGARQFLRADQPTHIEDAPNSTILDENTRRVYVEQLQAKSLLSAPLNAGGQWIGQIIAAYDQTLALSPRDLRVLQTLAAQAAVAVQNLRLFAETRRRATQLETAAEIARDTSGTLALDLLLNRAVNLIRDRYGYYHASIFLVDESGRSAVVRESTGIAGQELKRRSHSLPVGSQSVIGQVTQSGQTVVINDVTQSEMHRPNPLLPDTRAEMAAPLKIGTRIIGALDVQAAQIDAFSSDDMAVLQGLANQIAVAVDNARSYELAQQAISETAQRVQELSTIYEVSQAIAGATMQTQEIANTIVGRFVNLFPVDRVILYMLDMVSFLPEAAALPSDQSQSGSQTGSIIELPPPVQVLKMLAATSPRGDLPLWEDDLPFEKYPFGSIALQRVVQTVRPLVVQADLPISVLVTALDPEAVRLRDSQTLMQKAGLRTLVLIPLAAKGQVIGLVELQARTLPIQPDASQLNLVMTIANSAAVSLENAQLYEDQLATAEKLREVDKLKSQFLANMSHELRTPLNSIIGFSRVILKGIDGPTTDLQQQDLSAIHSAGTHLLQLINDVLDISKIEAGKMELAFDDDVNLTDLVNSAMSTAVGLTKDRPVRLEKQIEPNLPPVRADATRLRQVIINFLSNAAKFTEEGVITVRVARQLSAQGQPEVRLSVTDTGPGIAKEDQAKLFQPFSQVDGSATRKVGGTGLGLSISRLLVEMHGGYIGVDSDVGAGSTFFFVLPLLSGGEPPEFGTSEVQTWPAMATPFIKKEATSAAALQASSTKLAPPVKESQPEPDLPETKAAQPELSSNQATETQPESFSTAGKAEKKTVLIIDDDRQVINLYDRYLRDNGYNTISLVDSGLALDTARLLRPYAITLDIMMPNRDGWQVLRSLKSDPATRDIPVIICSIVEEQEKGFSLGATDYLNKPIMEDDLLKAVKRINGDGAIQEILIIDDDPLVFTLIEKLLGSGPETHHYRLRQALGGKAGLAALQNAPPDAVILDLFMPDLDGFAVLEAMRSDPNLRNIPALVFTAADLNEAQQRRLAEFSQHLLHKAEVKEEDILRILQDALSRLGG